ncbi:MAG: hypothetical protein JNM84_24120 [Planctomycetes bacterium]|nr:hypothetical protein [Planctomycetota bacterium]
MLEPAAPLIVRLRCTDGIDRASRARRRGGRRGRCERLEGPVPRERRSRLDPASEELDLALSGRRLLVVRR